MQKRELRVGCTVRLKSSLKVDENYGKDSLLTLLRDMRTVRYKNEK